MCFSFWRRLVTGLERRKQEKVLRDLFPAVGFSPIVSYAPISQARTKFSKDVYVTCTKRVKRRRIFAGVNYYTKRIFVLIIYIIA